MYLVVRCVAIVHDAVCLQVLPVNESFSLDGLPCQFASSFILCCGRYIDFPVLLNSFLKTFSTPHPMLHTSGNVVIALN
jgi:hypothetical protein